MRLFSFSSHVGHVGHVGHARQLGLVAFALVGTGAAIAACGAGDDCDFGVCAGPTAGDGGSEGGGPVPAGCVESADAKDAPACVADGFAAFVDGAKGVDTNAGTKAAPFKTIRAALQAGKKRAYVCGAGPYAEHVDLGSSVSLFGGFDCATWTYNGTRAKVAPADAGYALHVHGVSAGLAISDLDFASIDGAADGESSIAGFVSQSKLSLTRVSFTAGKGAAGKKGDAGAKAKLLSVTGGGAVNYVGSDGSPSAGGAFKECTCEGITEVTRGGAGGSPTAGGGEGLPSDLPPTSGNNGAPGLGGKNCSTQGGFGIEGASAPAVDPAQEPNLVGVLTDNGWTPSSGNDGPKFGRPGQGGGGGGGSDASHGGSGGGCGGCGGGPGHAGQGGGGSIALLAATSSLSIVATAFGATDGGAGGEGGAGGTGDDGGSPGSTGLCSGGKGGHGAAGSAASGGAGGVSIAILYKGTAPTLDAATQGALTVGTFGVGGKGGIPGTNNGPDGVAEAMKDASTL